jgi:hypothetical protein
VDQIGRTLRRCDFVVALQETGFSLYRARQIVNAIFAAIAAALGRGESVETPAGTFIIKPPRSTGSRIRTRMAHAEDGQFSRQKFRRLESAPKSRIRFHLNQALPGKDFDDS